MSTHTPFTVKMRVENELPRAEVKSVSQPPAPKGRSLLGWHRQVDATETVNPAIVVEP